MRNYADYVNTKKLAHPDQRFGCVTFAQHADDLMLLNLADLMGIKRPSYLDLGAHDPHVISNTALLYELGSRGVNVEANPYLFEAFKFYRPQDKNINVGVGLQSGRFPFYMFDEKCGLNTFSREEAELWKHWSEVKKTIELPMMTLNEIVSNYCGGKYPDILLTDLEGLDYAVLNSADFSKSCPKIIVTESRRGNSALTKELLTEHHDYLLYCRMGENLFFVHRDFEQMVY